MRTLVKLFKILLEKKTYFSRETFVFRLVFHEINLYLDTYAYMIMRVSFLGAKLLFP